eukprot:TRINITY_DN5985_c0_g1_i1.p1 TRINITY_DN5985_c0_g1~~TRINITY_DN5985_c0_g1_i1.p1  ORF type:complete len:567 (-),score=152.34 TRINITY_DN5985_c0_g1_i1:1853-3553(-)
MRCPVCGSTDIEYDTSRADQSCTNCGFVLEESGVVVEVQFEESSNGGMSALGSFVPSSGMKGLSQSARPVGGGHGGAGLHSEESREMSLRKAQQRIRRVADQLKLTEHMVDQSLLVYKLALQNQFTRGRPALVVVGACIYVTCRREKTPHMLLDVADAIQAPLFFLGRTYLKLVHVLKLRIHVIDPSLYIHRFAAALGFEKKTHLVSMTALRLVSRMKRDWIQTGRRPAGICGGCLVIAARLHDFQITPAQVAKVVRMHESTLMKRMREFASTPSGELTLDEFNNTDMKAECDPPSFQKPLSSSSGKKRKAKSKALTEPDPKRLAVSAGDGLSVDESGALMTEEEARLEVENAMHSEDLTKLEAAVQNDDELKRSLLSGSVRTVLDDIDPDAPEPIVDENEEYVEVSEKVDKAFAAPRLPKSNSVDPVPPEPSKQPVRSTVFVDMDAAIKKLVGGDPIPEEDEELGSDLDDDEVRSMVVSDTNILQFKEKIWNHMHEDFVKEREEKRRVQAAMNEGKIKRKYTKKGPRSSMSSGSAAEAATKALSKSSTSSKINYAALSAIFGDEQ